MYSLKKLFNKYLKLFYIEILNYLKFNIMNKFIKFKKLNFAYKIFAFK